MKRFFLRTLALAGFTTGVLAVLAWSGGVAQAPLMSLASFAFLAGGVAAGLLDSTP